MVISEIIIGSHKFKQTKVVDLYMSVRSAPMSKFNSDPIAMVQANLICFYQYLKTLFGEK